MIVRPTLKRVLPVTIRSCHLSQRGRYTKTSDLPPNSISQLSISYQITSRLTLVRRNHQLHLSWSRRPYSFQQFTRSREKRFLSRAINLPEKGLKIPVSMSNQKVIAPYGEWKSPITIDLVAGGSVLFKEVHVNVGEELPNRRVRWLTKVT